jgi:hypothetical protein
MFVIPNFVEDYDVPKTDSGLKHYFNDLRYLNIVKKDMQLDWGDNKIIIRFSESITVRSIKMFKNNGIKEKDELIFNIPHSFTAGESIPENMQLDMFIHKEVS